MAKAVADKPPKTGGDDLDDGLELDEGLLAAESSDEEGIAAPVPLPEDGDEDEGEGIYVEEDDEDEERTPPETVSGVKRKAETGEDEEARKEEKKKRKKEKEKARKAKVRDAVRLRFAKS